MSNQARYPPPSQAGTQAIDETIELGAVFNAVETDLLVRTRVCNQHRQPHQIEAETRIEIVAERGQPLDEECADRLWIADSSGGADRNAFDHAVGTEQCKLEAAGTVAASDERGLEPGREALDAREHILLACDRLMKAPLRDVRCNRQKRRERLVLVAECAIELAQEVGAEACGERCARKLQNVADAFQAEAIEQGSCRGRQAQRCKRQRLQQTTFPARGDDRRGAETSGGGSRPDGCGDARACGKSKIPHPGEEVVAELAFTAKQMGAPADIQQDTVGRVDSDEGSIALTPIGDCGEQTGIGRRVFRQCDEIGMHGARLR